MREIKFRGRHPKTGKWFLGWLTQLPSDDSYQIIDYGEGGGGSCHDVDPATVGQYTGHSDVMGTDMYEGDIVTGYFEEDEWPAVVEWDEVSARFVLSGQSSVIPFDGMGDLEVVTIGNIHDNPELLTGDKTHQINSQKLAFLRRLRRTN